MKNKLIFVIFLIWAAFVIYFFNTALPSDPKKFFGYISSFSGLFALKGALAFFSDAVIEIVLAFFLLLISFIIGRKLTNSLKRNFDAPGFFAVSAAAGFCILAGSIFFLAAAGLLYEEVIFTVFILLCFYSLFDLYHNRFGFGSGSKKYSGTEKFLLAIICIFMLMNFSLSLLPETFFDSLEYHLAVPSAFILNHGFINLPYNIFSGFPGNAELLYLIGLALNGPVTAKLINFTFGILLLCSVYSFSKKYINRTAGLFAAALFCLMPVVAVNLINTQVDAFSAFWFFLAFYLAVNAGEERFKSLKMLAFAGLFAGFGMGVKYSGIIYASAITIVILYYCIVNKSFRKSGYVFSVFFFFALIPIVPWLVKNYLFFGYPFYPYFTDLPGAAKLLAEQKGIPLNNVLDLLKLPWSLTMVPPFASMNPGPAFLTFLPFLLWPVFKKSREKKPLKAVLLFVAAGLVFWLSLTRIVRFFIPGLIFISVYFAYLVTGFLKEEKEDFYSFSVFTLIAVIAVNNFIWVSNINFRNMDPVSLFSGKITKEEYLGRQKGTYPNPSFKAIDFLNKIKTEKGSKVLFVGETRPFYCKKPFIAGTDYDKIPFEIYLERAKSEGGLKEVFKKENISLILVNLREAKRLSIYKDLDLLSILKSREFNDAFTPVYFEESQGLCVFLTKN